jgi:hypothetical protein
MVRVHVPQLLETPRPDSDMGRALNRFASKPIRPLTRVRERLKSLVSGTIDAGKGEARVFPIALSDSHVVAPGHLIQGGS